MAHETYVKILFLKNKSAGNNKNHKLLKLIFQRMSETKVTCHRATSKIPTNLCFLAMAAPYLGGPAKIKQKPEIGEMLTKKNLLMTL